MAYLIRFLSIHADCRFAVYLKKQMYKLYYIVKEKFWRFAIANTHDMIYMR